MRDLRRPDALGIIEFEPLYDAEAARRRRALDDFITWTLTLAVTVALVWWWVQSSEGTTRSGTRRSATIEQPCPAADVRLNSYEYELQRRRCEAIQSGALAREEDRRRRLGL